MTRYAAQFVLTALATAASNASGSDAARGSGQQVQREVEHVSTLTRVREGGTPYDPNQRLTPYAVTLADGKGADGGVADAPASGLISTPPEYAPARGVLY
ncbi:MAG: hypothetical protein FGM37_10830, partial [Phycisphaerales bacterium]|nr:hypothetical protein [Phycisphaerales bacterium]